MWSPTFIINMPSMGQYFRFFAGAYFGSGKITGISIMVIRKGSFLVCLLV